MKKFFRFAAFITAAVMSLSMLCACQDGKTDDNVTDNDNSNVSDEPSIVKPSLTINGESIDISDNPVMLTVDGIEIRFDEFRYMFKYLESMYGLNGLWEGNEENYPVFLQTTVDYLLENNFGNIMSKQYDVTLTSEDMEEVEDYLAQEIDQFESREAFDEALEQSGITEELLRHLIESSVMSERIYLDLYGGENPRLTPSDEEIKKNLSQDYVRVYHILISNDHFKGSEGYDDYTSDQLKEAAKTYAEQTLEAINLGGEDFYLLSQSIGDDSGMRDNEAGYLFTKGEMVEEFEKASFDLEVGEVSGVVETDYGYHIILRLEQDQYVEDNFETVRKDYINDIFNRHVDQVIMDADIVYSDYYNKLTIDSIT